MIGDIHSHHSRSGKDISFSPLDLYQAAAGDDRSRILGVIQGSEVMFAFQTKETAETALSWTVGWQEFVRHWCDKYGYKYEYDENAHYLKQNSDHALAIPAFTYGIADAHNLVIYKGKIGEPLRRDFPN